MDDFSRPKQRSNWGTITAGTLICLILFAMAVQRVVEDERQVLRKTAISLSESLEIRLHKASDITNDTWLLHLSVDATMEEMMAFNHEHLRNTPYVGAILHLVVSGWGDAEFHPYGATEAMPVLARHHLYALNTPQGMPDIGVLNAALMEAIDSGKEVYSDEAHLDSGEMVFYLAHPYYGESGLNDVDARRDALEGVVVALVRPKALLEDVGHEETDDFLYSGDTLLAEWRHAENAEAGWMLPHLSESHTFRIQKRPYTLVLEKPLYWRAINPKLPILALLLGLLISGLLFALKRSYNARAQMLLERNNDIRRQVARQTEELRRSKAELERQRFALDQHAIVSITDAVGDIIYINDKFCEISGYSREELIGKNHRLLKSDEHPPEFFNEMWRTISHGEVWSGVVCNRRKDGGYYWVSSTIVPFIDDNGLPYQYVSIRTDISPVKAVEQALHDNEERLRRSQNFANIGTWDWNIKSGDLFWSERIAPLFGYQSEEVETTYENFLAAVHPDDRELVTDAVSACVEGRAEYNIEHRVVWPDGQVRWLSEKGDVVRDEDGSPLHMLGVVQDIHDRKMAELALAESKAELAENEEKFRSLYEMSPVGIALNEMDGRFVEANQAFLDIVGYSADECQTLSYWELTPKEYETQEAQQIESLEENGRYGPYEKEYIHRDGHRVAVLLNGTVVHDQSGGKRIWSIVQDISQRKEAEQSLRESEERFAFAVEGAGDGIWDWDMGSGYMRFSREYMAMLGYEQYELPQHVDTWADSVYPEDMPQAQQLLQDYLEGRAPNYAVELRLRCKDGHYKWILCRGTVVEKDEQGNATRMIGIHSDISERKAMEFMLEKQRTLLDMLHTSMSSFVAQKDFHATINGMLEGLLEVTHSEYGFTGEVMWDENGAPYLKTHAITNIAWNDETQKLYDEFAEKGFEFRNLDTLFGRVMTSGQPVMSNDPAHDPRAGGLPEGHPPMYSFLGAPVYYGSEMVGMYGIANRPEGYDDALLKFLEPFDITYGVIIHSHHTQRLQEENREQLLEAREAAVLANKAKSDFLSSMSHELRTPMNAILGFAQLLEGEENLTADQRENIHDIVKAGHHLLDLINEVLDLAKIEAGKMELSIEVVPLDDVMDTVKKLIQPLASQREIQLHLQSDCMTGHFIHADYTRVKQILLNLLSNAVKYNREGGDVFVDCVEASRARLRIAVRDTGVGIASDKLEKLFEAFNRLNVDNSIEGTGIGLVITRQLVELMGGDMGVESEEGVGSTFWFELPRIEGDKVTVKAVPSDERRAQVSVEGEHTVLYIEDNPVNLKLVTKLIAKLDNVRLLTAEEPVRGLELAAEERPDLILLDINLPGMSGFEVVRHLRDSEVNAGVPVIALSANAMAEDIEKGREAGFDDYLTKPINVKKFFEVLARYLDQVGG